MKGGRGGMPSMQQMQQMMAMMRAGGGRQGGRKGGGKVRKQQKGGNKDRVPYSELSDEKKQEIREKHEARAAEEGRVEAGSQQYTGTVVQRGKRYGWIKPQPAVNHPKARDDGKVFFSAEDVAAELDGVGAKVSFTLYTDKQGVGAADVRMATGAAAKGSTAPSAPKFKAAAKAAATQKAAPVKKTNLKQNNQKSGGNDSTSGRTVIWDKPLLGKVDSWKGGFAK